MNAADRVAMLAAIGIRIELTPDATQLDVSGPLALIDAAAPMLRHNRACILDYLLVGHAGAESAGKETP